MKRILPWLIAVAAIAAAAGVGYYLHLKSAADASAKMGKAGKGGFMVWSRYAVPRPDDPAPF